MYCELCDMDNCADHGAGHDRAARHATQRQADVEIQVSPRNMAHFPGCSHKAGDEDFTEWGFIRGVKDAWTRLGNGEHLATNAGVKRVATSRCRNCETTGPLGV